VVDGSLSNVSDWQSRPQSWPEDDVSPTVCLALLVACVKNNNKIMWRVSRFFFSLPSEYSSTVVMSIDFKNTWTSRRPTDAINASRPGGDFCAAADSAAVGFKGPESSSWPEVRVPVGYW